ncbi:hypothetical protein [Sphingobacterium endophyticum]|uniref:hypothetical protein n=1 Tax=Sphingobacterium endophyticum TaxID=2546448 RepID=UPI0012E271AE|nr:hypothetical protein [Sphingobacterium endophyticum]
MKKKRETGGKKDSQVYIRKDEPKRTYLKHVNNQARRMEELMDEGHGEQYIRDTLNEWPELMRLALEKFRREKGNY